MEPPATQHEGEDGPTGRKPVFTVHDRQLLAEQAAREAAAAAAELPLNSKHVSAKQRRKLEHAVQEKEKDAQRAAIYASLAANKMKTEHLRLLGSSSTLAQTASKRQVAERAADAQKQGLALAPVASKRCLPGDEDDGMQTSDADEPKRAKAEGSSR